MRVESIQNLVLELCKSLIIPAVFIALNKMEVRMRESKNYPLIMKIREKFRQYPTDMQQWMIQQEKTKLTRVETALKNGKKLYAKMEDEEKGQWLLRTTIILEQYLSLLPERNCSLDQVSDDYIFQVWEILENDPSLRELIAQVETRYEGLLKV
ncbi:hypothetical protein [Crocosphaera watsonii]|nr:hypothetical protein [Crocosphaera watsonii]